MGVNSHGDLWVCMTKLLADVEDIRPIAQELACERVPEVVEPDVPQASLVEYPLEVIPLRVSHIQETAPRVGEHPYRDFIPALSHRLFLHLPAKVAQCFQ